MTRPPTHRPHHVVTLGAAFSANKGAASMLHTVVERLPEHAGDCRFSVLTTYPDADRERRPDGPIEIVPATPVQLLAVNAPLALLHAILGRLRLPRRWLLRTPALRAMADADLVVDIAGISFVDGRGLPILGYNTLMTGIPLLLGTPVVKASQALGPFRTRINRAMARLVLPRVTTVFGRGDRTMAHLEELGLDNARPAADLAFGLDEASDLPDAVTGTLDDLGGRYVVVMPSAVVEAACRKSGIDYTSAMSVVIEGIAEVTGRPVVIAPHSYQPGQPSSRMNDGPICQAIAGRVGPVATLIDDDLSPGQLRHLIHGSDLTVTSRFHAMISALATTRPVLVLGWSHKYHEVLSEFDLAELALDHRALEEPSDVVAAVRDLWSRREGVSRSIDEHLPVVRERSDINFLEMARLLTETT